jgi:hypothetical protein
MRRSAQVRIPVCPAPPLVFSRELLGKLCTGFLVVSLFRIACEAEAQGEYAVVTENFVKCVQFGVHSALICTFTYELKQLYLTHCLTSWLL